MAGESAARSARRMRERAEQLHRTAALWERGVEGERRTADALSALPANEWTVFHDVPWPGRARANIDHVAVGPTGIFVIDSKNWSGSITVRNGVLRQNGYRRDEVISGAVEAASAVASFVPGVRRSDVHSVVCLVSDERIVASIGGVALTSIGHLVRELVDRPAVFSPEGREGIAWELELRLHRGSPLPWQIAARPHSATPKPPRRRRRKSGQGLVSAIVGGALAVGVLAVGFSHPEVFQRFGHAFVSLVVDDAEQPPADEPGVKPKKGQQKKDRRSE